jgi:23S rRNA (pseudouridine1915-N3)-methyltransferase
VKLIVAAVGTRMPSWVDAAFTEFAKRMPRELSMDLIEVKAEPRSTGKPVAAMLAAEAERLESALPANCRRVVLDERGDDLTTKALAQRLQQWMGEGRNVAFLIGGPDGLAPTLRAATRDSLRLSSLTLPHALVRVILAEALYRASSLLRDHPYHRE